MSVVHKGSGGQGDSQLEDVPAMGWRPEGYLIGLYGESDFQNQVLNESVLVYKGGEDVAKYPLVLRFQQFDHNKAR